LHPEHAHWHLEGVAQYNLFKSLDDGFQRTLGSLVAQSDKVSFCLIFFFKRIPLGMIDVYPLVESHVPALFKQCSGNNQGISPNWVDL
jgi:hypothetical protein